MPASTERVKGIGNRLTMPLEAPLQVSTPELEAYSWLQRLWGLVVRVVVDGSLSISDAASAMAAVSLDAGPWPRSDLLYRPSQVRCGECSLSWKLSLFGQERIPRIVRPCSKGVRAL